MTKMNIPQHVKQLMQQLIDSGYECFIIGGAVRDMLLKKVPHDYDLFTNATGEQILSVFPQGVVMGGEERQKKILTVIVDGIEISQYRSNGDRTEVGTSFTHHINTCDFTINAMALDIEGNLRDHVGGCDDIYYEKIRFVGDSEARIREDPLRLFRAIRFSSTLNFSFDEIDVIKKHLHLIDTLPKERIRVELHKILQTERGIVLLDYYGFLSRMLPDWEIMRMLDGGKHHNETVHQHLLYAFIESKKLTDNPLVHLAALLHDIGKGVTHSYDEEGDIHFYEHESIGAKMVEFWMTNMKYSKEDIKFVVCLVRNHMWDYDNASHRSLVKHFNYFKEAGVSIMDYLIVLYSDNQGNQKNKRQKFSEFVEKRGLIQKYYELVYSTTPFTVADLAIKGQDLLDMGMVQGKAVGEFLASIYDLVMDGVLPNNRPELMNYARSKLQ